MHATIGLDGAKLRIKSSVEQGSLSIQAKHSMYLEELYTADIYYYPIYDPYIVTFQSETAIYNFHQLSVNSEGRSFSIQRAITDGQFPKTNSYSISWSFHRSSAPPAPAPPVGLGKRKRESWSLRCLDDQLRCLEHLRCIFGLLANGEESKTETVCCRSPERPNGFGSVFKRFAGSLGCNQSSEKRY